MGNRTVAIVTAGILLLTGIATSPAVGAKVPAAPRNAKVTVQVGGVTVSWSTLATTGVTYRVASTPAGLACDVVDASQCSFTVLGSTPYRFSVTATTPTGTSPPSGLTKFYKQRTLLVVAGQSNALGAGSLAVDPSTRINYYRSPYANGADSASTITWAHLGLVPMPADRPVKLSSAQNMWLPNGSTSRIFGPELGLARGLYASRHLPVTVVKATWGGTSLAGEWDQHDPGTLFWQLVDHYNTLVSADAAKGQLDTLGMIYWYQGEKDMTDPAQAAAYQDNLVDLVEDLRLLLDGGADAPFAIVKPTMRSLLNFMATFGNDAALVAADRAGEETVRAADDWVAANIPGVTIAADARNYTFNPADLVHLANVGEIALGAQLASATASLIR